MSMRRIDPSHFHKPVHNPVKKVEKADGPQTAQLINQQGPILAAKIGAGE